MTHWNYRVVDMTMKEYPEEPWFEIREVFYNEKNEPCGHTKVSVGGEDMDEMELTMDRFDGAMQQPVLVQSDFIGKFNEESFH